MKHRFTKHEDSEALEALIRETIREVNAATQDKEQLIDELGESLYYIREAYVKRRKVAPGTARKTFKDRLTAVLTAWKASPKYRDAIFGSMVAISQIKGARTRKQNRTQE